MGDQGMVERVRNCKEAQVGRKLQAGGGEAGRLSGAPVPNVIILNLNNTG
jgi:hypothetical protein